MKTTLLALLLALSPIMATAENDTARARLTEFKHLNERIEQLEKAIRLQTLTTEAIRRDDYLLACKAQKEAAIATHMAHVRDVVRQSDMQFAEICSYLRHSTEPDVPAWLKPVASFEPAGVYVEKK